MTSISTHLQKSAESHKAQAIDLFSGCGGLTKGLEDAGFNVVAAVEIDKKAIATYKMNHPNVLLIGQDIRQLDPISVLDELKLRPGELDLIAGCPPCQGFSRIRQKNKGLANADPRNSLIDDFMRFVAAIRPKMIMLENVPGLSSYEGYRSFKEKLLIMNYKICDAVLDVSRYGVPQRRKRLILVAAMHSEPSLARECLEKTTVRDAISCIPKAGISGDQLHDLEQKRSPRIRALIESIPKDGGSRKSLPLSDQLSCHRRTSGFSDVYGRMAWDSLAPTITGGCYNPSKGRFLHPSEDRAITLREAAILQGFPQDYKFDVGHGRESISLMIGNALPPPFISAHAKKLLELWRG